MPSGPTSLACDACRSRKRKCDLKQPICGRCQDTKTPCTGSGQRRIVFVAHKIPTSVPKSSRSPGRAIFIPEAVPNSQSFRVAQLLSTHLASADDLRYNITWLWGGFVSDLPRHMIYHEALTNSVAALLMIYQALCTDQPPTRSLEAILRRSYLGAIQSVRHTLETATSRSDPQTLCAVILLSSISPYFESIDTVFSNAHAKACLDILRMRNFKGNNDDSFDSTMLSMLRNATALKAIVDCEWGLTTAEWDAFESCYQGSDLITRLLRCAVQIGRLFDRARSSQVHSQEEYLAFQQGVELKANLDLIVQHLYTETQTQTLVCITTTTDTTFRPQAQALRNYTSALTLHAQLLSLLQALCLTTPTPSSNPSQFVDFHTDLHLLKTRALSLAERARIYRPLGANWVVIVLMATWGALMAVREWQREVEGCMDGWREGSVVPRGVLWRWWGRVSLGRGWGREREYGGMMVRGFGGVVDGEEEEEEDRGGWNRSNLLFVPARTALY